MENDRRDMHEKDLYEVQTHAPGPSGRLPLDADWLRETASGNVFGWTQDAAMGWNPDELGRDEFLILSTQAEYAPLTAPRSRWVTTPGTGRSVCWLRLRQTN
jgi:hypothetical protein